MKEKKEKQKKAQKIEKKELIEELEEKNANKKEMVEEIDKKEKKITKTKIKEIINRFFNSIGFTIVIGILLFLKTIFFYLNTISILTAFPLEKVYRISPIDLIPISY